MIRIKKRRLFSIIIVLFIVLSCSLLFLFSDFSKAANIIGPNYKNATLLTKVNITNAKPEVLSLTIYQDANSSIKNVTLSAGATRLVVCNATARDWNGYNDIVLVNATLWDITNTTINASDDNNSHYSNTNCTNAGNGANFTVNYICNFSVYYYANNGTWNCNATAVDTYNKTGSNVNSTFIYTLYALNVTDGIDYGNVAVEDYSNTQTANITNFGNRPINISVEGYGVSRGDGLAMNCSINGNITVNNERFSAENVAWAAKVPLNGTLQQVANLTVSKQTLSDTPIINSTYWQLYIPPNPAGNCSGWIIFTAQVS